MIRVRTRGIVVGSLIAMGFALATGHALGQGNSISQQLEGHDANIDSDLAAHDTAVLALHPIPISACTTIDQPGSYRVVQNLSAAGDCLLVAADNVTIDLGGFTLSGDSSGNGITDGFTPHTNIAVHDGTVSGFGRGIDLVAGTAVTIRNVRAVDNTDFGIVTTVGSLVSGNIAVFNDDVGIAIGGGSVVTNNTATANGGDGIRVFPGSTVGGNAAWQNSGIGLSVRCPSNVFDNTAFQNGTNLVFDTNAGSCNDVNNLAP